MQHGHLRLEVYDFVKRPALNGKAQTQESRKHELGDFHGKGVPGFVFAGRGDCAVLVYGLEPDDYNWTLDHLLHAARLRKLCVTRRTRL